MTRVRRFPLAVAMVAMSVAVIRMIPWLYAAVLTPAGWTFTGNLTKSPDIMQYRVWFHQSQVEGLLVTNAFTSESNRPHLLLLYPWAFGKIGGLLSVPPEFVYAWAGFPLATLMVLVLWWLVRQFFQDTYQAWWVFFAILVGGGLGAHLKLLTRFDAVKQNSLLRRLFVEPQQTWPVFEDRRGHYLFQTLFETHFLLFWLLATMCMAAMYVALRDGRPRSLVALGALCGLLTLAHLYDGMLLLAVAGAVAVLCWFNSGPRDRAVRMLGVVAIVVSVCLGWQIWLALRAGIPVSAWNEQSVLTSLLFLAYPIFWVLLARGLPKFWASGRLEHLFLLGWALGCTVLAFSGPFNPYPQRGTLTLMIPIGLLAGLEYFRERSRVSMTHAALALFVLAPTPLWYVAATVSNLRFDTHAPTTYLDEAHRDMVDALRSTSVATDVFLAAPEAYAWLAPGFSGRLYCGHFALTVEYERKRHAVEQFFSSSAEWKRQFLAQNGVRLVFVEAREASTWPDVVGLRVVLANAAGTLYAFEPQAMVAVH